MTRKRKSICESKLLTRQLQQAADGLARTKLQVHDTIRFAPHDLRERILERDSSLCRYCGTQVTMDTANIDHVLPWKHNGATDLSNLVTTCRNCNKRKGNNPNVYPMPLDNPFTHQASQDKQLAWWISLSLQQQRLYALRSPRCANHAGVLKARANKSVG